MQTFFKRCAIAAIAFVSMISLSACKHHQDNATSDSHVLNQPEAGSPATQPYADKPATVENTVGKGANDPYTGTPDKKNFAGKSPVAPDQTVADHLKNKNNP